MTEQEVVPKPTDLRPTYSRLHDLIQFRLFSEEIPSAYTSITVADGRALCQVAGEFEIELTIVREDAIAWRVLALRILVQPAKESGDVVPENLQQNLADFLQSHILDCERPLRKIFDITHHFCLSLGFQILQSQAAALAEARKGHLLLNLVGDVLTVFFWTAGRSLTDVLADENYKSRLDITKITFADSPPVLGIRRAENSSRHMLESRVDLSQVSLEALLSDMLSHLVAERLSLLYRMICNKAGQSLPIQLEDVSLVSKDLNRVLQTSIHIHLLEREYLIISMEIYSGHYVASLSTNPSQTLLEMNKLLSPLTETSLAIISEMKKEAVRTMIAKYLKMSQIIPFEKPTLTFPESISFSLPSHATFFRVPEIFNFQMPSIGLVAVILSDHFQLDFYFIFGIPSALPNVNVTHVILLAQGVQLSDVQSSVSPKTEPLPAGVSLVDFKITNGPLLDVIESLARAAYQIGGMMNFQKKNIKDHSPVVGPNGVQFFVDSYQSKVKFSYEESREQWCASLALEKIHNQMLALNDTESGNLKVSFNSKTQQFNVYSRMLMEGIFYPWQEFERFLKTIELVKQWEKIQASMATDNEFLKKFFTLSMTTTSQVTFSYNLKTLGHQTVTITPQGTTMFTVNCSQSLPFEKFFEGRISLDRELKSVLLPLARMAPSFEVLRSTWCASNTIRAKDFCFIPLDTAILRVSFRKAYGVDLRFNNNTGVVICDWSKRLFIKKDSLFGDRAVLVGLQPLLASDYPATQQPHDNIFVPFEDFGSALVKIHRLMGCLHLFGHIEAFLQQMVGTAHWHLLYLT